jgi:uroporphyrinogen-III synthase
LPSARTVWITRAEPGASATAARVRALGFDPLVAPLLAIRSKAASLNLEPFEALAFTSSQALLHLPPDLPRDRRVFAVGDATAEAARRAGFTDVLSAAGDVDALAALILNESPLAVAHPSADRTAGDLVRQLTDAGLPARRVTVYRAEPCKTLPPMVAQAVYSRALAAVLIHSPRGGQIAAALIAREKLAMEDVEVLGLSPACLKPLARTGFRRIRPAAAPREADLLTLLADLPAGAR